MNNLTSSLDRYFRKGNYATSYTEITNEPSQFGWRDGMVSGDGENGYITSGAPYSDTFIFQNIWFIFPTSHPRFIPEELTDQLPDARENTFQLNDQWKVTDRNGQTRRRTFYYSYHPSHQLRLQANVKSKAENYLRWTNYETAETGVSYTDEHGEWLRTSFTSRADHVSITKVTKSSLGTKVNMIISIDDITSMPGVETNLIEVDAMQYKKLVDCQADYIAQIAHYPDYSESELRHGGYCGFTKVIVVNGSKERVLLEDTNEAINVAGERNPAIKISDADAVYLITKSDRSFEMGELGQFAEMGSYPLLEELKQYVDEVAQRYCDDDGHFHYEEALAAHCLKHTAIFNEVELQLTEERQAADVKKVASQQDNIKLIQAQQENTKQIYLPLMEQAYNQGRYAMICSSGVTAPRLYGMWVGEWNPGWRSIYTLDANVNLQVAAMNTGCIADGPYGYIVFFLRNAPDFALNAQMAYGMHDALQVSVNSDGDRAMHVEYDNDYPFQYWNAGASWCLLPIYEYWQCYGNQRIPIHANMRIENLQPLLGVEDGGLSDHEFNQLMEQGYLDLERHILLPLLTKQANFWEQICTPEYYTNLEGKACYEKGKLQLEPGERYIIIPTYSPENHPIGYNSTITANATMDIAAARDGLAMVIAIERAVKRPGYKKAIEKWEKLLGQLPLYLYDDDGALREWAMKEYIENNNHRHLSHLYCAWPAYETNNNEELMQAAKIALENRNIYNTEDDTAGHGWMHKALVAARLKDGKAVEHSLLPMMVNQGYYASLMTDHDSNRRCYSYCTDTLYGTVAVINEALLYSNTGEIQLLPALPPNWNKGSINGLAARAGIKVKALSWDIEQGVVTATISASVSSSSLKLSLALPWSQAELIYSNANLESSELSEPRVVEGGENITEIPLQIAKGQEITIIFSLLKH